MPRFGAGLFKVRAWWVPGCATAKTSRPPATNRLRVLFDAFWWAKGPISNRAVLVETVLAWHAEHPTDEIHLGVRSRHYREVRSALPSSIFVHRVRLYPHALVCMFEIPLLGASLGISQIVTQNFASIIGPKSAVFLYDLIFETNPEWFSRKERAYFSLMSRTINRARTIFTLSSTEALRIKALHPQAPTPIATGLGLKGRLVQANVVEPSCDVAPFGFVLAVGRLNVRKNLKYLVEVAVKSGLVTPVRPLVIVGPEGSVEEKQQLKLVGGAENILFTGRIDDDELAWYYKYCAAFVFLSRDEGFGLPVIEAAYFSAPLYLSDIPVMREVSQEDATFVPLDNVPAAIATIRGSLEGLRDRPVENAPRDGRAYSWKEVVSIMRSAMGGE